MTQDILVLADEYAAAVVEYAKGIATGADSMSPLARDAGDKRMALAEAIAAARVQDQREIEVLKADVERLDALWSEWNLEANVLIEDNKKLQAAIEVAQAQATDCGCIGPRDCTGECCEKTTVEPFKALSDDEILWIAKSHGIDVYACNVLGFYTDLISTSPVQAATVKEYLIDQLNPTEIGLRVF